MFCDPRLSNSFAWLWTLESLDAILSKANGSTCQEVSKGNFRPLPVVVPPESVLRAFDAIAKPLHAHFASNERESGAFARTRDPLLSCLSTQDALLSRRIEGTARKADIHEVLTYRAALAEASRLLDGTCPGLNLPCNFG